ncbi:glyoxalase/bleomycin resistance/extradiol dioxygenase family protein [Gracilibacillus salitolerans]|uniref:Glyoxalase/bleomycin resistance/extradiol dioxygenase family protein n=1 Tax=Gracilibacillus salitolerans TaxID=2663022 RepID=A0A5Q2TLQ4_9BACI|nr:VOC family protein [Gracilibacillus salitolerans]QGH35017.1 glyoxalase/bleomycin resistance/extradiol dioxygenase family protein [Gracilibacillus salitolerans]
MSLTSQNIFVNLPIKNLKKSVEFFSALGFEFNQQFTDETTTCMIVNDNIFVMLLEEERFQDFTSKEIVDATKATEVLIALSAESPEKVDEMVNNAIEAGGSRANEKQDHGFMYGWSFQDLDGHIWEIVYMDESYVE